MIVLTDRSVDKEILLSLSDDYQVEHRQGPHLTLKKSLPAVSGLGDQTRSSHSSYWGIKWNGGRGRFDTPQVLTKAWRPPLQCRQWSVHCLGDTNTCGNRNGSSTNIQAGMVACLLFRQSFGEMYFSGDSEE